MGVEAHAVDLADDMNTDVAASGEPLILFSLVHDNVNGSSWHATPPLAAAAAAAAVAVEGAPALTVPRGNAVV